METLEGFPNLPALWLRQAKPASAYAFDGNPDLKHLSPRSLWIPHKSQCTKGRGGDRQRDLAVI